MKIKIARIMVLALAPLAAAFLNTRIAEACYAGCNGTAPNRTCVFTGEGALTCWSDGFSCHFGGTCL
jgi:hypothetical protein